MNQELLELIEKQAIEYANRVTAKKLFPDDEYLYHEKKRLKGIFKDAMKNALAEPEALVVFEFAIEQAHALATDVLASFKDKAK